VLVGNAKQTVFTEPGRSAIVVAVTGNAGETDRSYASTALASAVAKAGMGGLLVPSRTTGDAATMAKELCSAHRAGAIFGGMLSMQQVGAALTRAAEATFELVRYDCNGNVTTREQAQAKAMGRTRNTAAIDRAVEKSLDAALHPKTKRM
jgi:hypothetical protein